MPASYADSYKKLVDTEIRTSVSRARPRKIYKILSYEYADGHVESYSGANACYVFVLGRYDGKMYCLKMTHIKPQVFFGWLKTVIIKNLKKEQIVSKRWLETMIPKSDRGGSKLFNNSVKGKPIYDKDPSPFRTYILKNIKQILWVELKLEELAKLYNIKLDDENLDNKKETEKNEAQPTK